MESAPGRHTRLEGGACCGDSVPPGASPSSRSALIRQAFWLEWLSIGWMAVEAVVAIGSGIVAGSLTLMAFGLDSLIELASAGVLIWRLNVELRQGQAFSEAAERRASRIAGALLFGLAGYIIIGAAWSFWTRHGEAFSVTGLIIATLAMPIMYFLAQWKIAVADGLGSRAMRADAVESITCGWLSLVVVIAAIVALFSSAWWVDPMASLAILWLVVREGREAWRGEDCCGG